MADHLHQPLVASEQAPVVLEGGLVVSRLIEADIISLIQYSTRQLRQDVDGVGMNGHVRHVTDRRVQVYQMTDAPACSDYGKPGREDSSDEPTTSMASHRRASRRAPRREPALSP